MPWQQLHIQCEKSQAELAERIAQLEAEIARVRRHSEGARAHRAAADALFGKKD